MSSPPATPSVEVVWAHVGRDPAAWADLLDSDERARMARLRRPEDRAAYALAHGLLRLELGRASGVAPGDWRFVPTPHGKPVVARPQMPPGPALDFSLTHTTGLVAVAIGRGVRVGVDAEASDRPVDPDEIAADVLSPIERAGLAAAAGPGERHRRFLVLWTLKEAYAKGLGLGVRLPFAEVAFAPGPAAPDGSLAEATGLAGCDPAWRLASGTVGGRHVLAVAWTVPDGVDVAVEIREHRTFSR